MKYNRREAKVRVSFVHATDEDGRRYAPMWLMATHLRELPEPEWEQDGEDPYSGCAVRPTNQPAMEQGILTPFPRRGSGDAGVGGLAAVRLP